MTTAEAVAMIAATVSRAVESSSMAPEEVAARAGMTCSQLSRKLDGSVALDVAELANVADALGVTPEVFFRADSNQNDNNRA